MSLNSQALCLSELGRHEAALKAIEEAVPLVMRILERTPYVLPDSGLRLLRSYVELCERTHQEADDEVLQRMYEVLVPADVVEHEQ